MNIRRKLDAVNVWRLPDYDGLGNFINKLPNDLPLDVSYAYSTINPKPDGYMVKTELFTHYAFPGDYLIQDNHDEIWLLEKAVFDKIYEIVED